MKPHYVLLAFTAILFSANAVAQDKEFELLLVPSLTNIRGNDLLGENNEAAFRFSAGVGYNYLFQNRYFIKGALMYENKGVNGKTDLRDANNVSVGAIEYHSHFNYITVPLQYGRRFGTKTNFDVAIGAYAGYLIQDNIEITSRDLDVKQTNTGFYKKFDYGLVGSAAAYFPIRKGLSIKAGLQYSFGLAEIADNERFNDFSVKNNSLGLQLGLNVRLHSAAN